MVEELGTEHLQRTLTGKMGAAGALKTVAGLRVAVAASGKEYLQKM